MNSIFCSPSRYTQGLHATQSLGGEMAGLGLASPVLIAASRSPRTLLKGTWQKTLSDAGFAFSVHDFSGECTHAEVARIAAAAGAAGAATILGAGGGKVLDAARAAAADLQLPFVSCPTVASTDAPCCAISVIYNEEGVFEVARLHPVNPALVLVDSHVIAQAPVRTLVAGMGDALSTLFEARACVAAKRPNTRGGSCTLSALALAELCYRTLLADGVEALRAAGEKRVTPALERIIEANTLLSGLGFESAGLAAAHGVHNALTAAPGTHAFMHGEKVAFGVIVQLMLEGAERALVDEVLAFCQSVGLPMTLASIGCADLSAGLLSEVAELATVPDGLIHNEPFPVTPRMVEDAIRAADAAGRAFTG
ncbi:MAG: glycerol dehydrogenase [Verrucomicrobiota bacterium]